MNEPQIIIPETPGLPTVQDGQAAVALGGETLKQDASLVVTARDDRSESTEDAKAKALQKQADEIAKIRELAEKDRSEPQQGAIPSVASIYYSARIALLQHPEYIKDTTEADVRAKAVAKDYAAFVAGS